MQSPLPTPYRKFFSPLSLAAYVAIAAVWFTSVPALTGRDPSLGVWARLCIGGFALAFVLVVSPGESKPRYWLSVLVMGVCAFALLYLGPSGASPILLVLLAAILAAELSGPRLLLVLCANNLLLFVLIRWQWGGGWQSTTASVLGIASFQVFASLLMRYASQAEAMAEALRASNADLLATRSLLAESTRDAERLRLSRELHDVAGHKLTALKLNLAALTRDPRRQGDDTVRLCAQLADELLADIRTVVRQLRQDEGIDLHRAIAALAAPLPRPRLQLDIADDARAENLEQAEAVLRSVQEALTNTARHSQAQQLWVVLRRDHGRLVLDIRDDGRGHGELRPGNGLTGMRERLQALGGDLAVGRTGTGGVHLQAWLPMTP